MADMMIERLRDEADLCANDGAEDIARLLNEAAAEMAELLRWRNEYHTQAQHAQQEIRDAHAAMDAAGFPRLQPSGFPYSLVGRVRARNAGVDLPDGGKCW